MPGFFVISTYLKANSSSPSINIDKFNQQLFYESQEESIHIFSDSNQKFKNDQLFFQDENYIIVLEGVILNCKHLCQKYKKEDWKSTFVAMYEQNNDTFHLEFRGSFYGLVYDKNSHKWQVFVSPIGDKEVFYSQNSNQVLFGSEIKYFINYFKKNSLPYQLDVDAAYMILTFGFLLEGFTLFKEIRKITAGHQVMIESRILNINQYHQFSSQKEIDISEEAAIEKLDTLFKQAIKRNFDKDIEYGYQHLVTLSGGLDSRMTTWVAHQLGYSNFLDITFSQSGYLDQTIAQKIAFDLNHTWLYKTLGKGLYLKTEFQNTLHICGGAVAYCSLAHVNSFMTSMNSAPFGIVHTGGLGDMTIGSYYSKRKEKNGLVNYKAATHSLKLMDRIDQLSSEISKHYANTEIFLLYNRWLNGTLQGNLVFQKGSETLSPFYDLDFMEFCMSLPLELKMDHYLYKKWIKTKYPEAGKYKWEYLDANLYQFTLKFNGHTHSLPKIKRAIIKRINKYIFKGSKPSRHNMNPLDFWYQNNSEIRDFMDSFMKENIPLLDAYPLLQKDIDTLYKTGDTYEKTQAMTVLGAFKMYFH